jgi:hypothetical protein
MHRLEVLSACAHAARPLPVLDLTAADSVEERVKGLTMAPTTTYRRFIGEYLRRSAPQAGRGQHRTARWCMTSPAASPSTAELELSARTRPARLLQRAGRSGQRRPQLVERLCEWGEEVSNNAIGGLANPPLAQKISKSARFASPQSAAFRAASKKKYQPKPEVASHGRAIHMRLSARTTKPFRGGNPGLIPRRRCC